MGRIAAITFLLVVGWAHANDEPDCDPSSGLALDASCLDRKPSTEGEAKSAASLPLAEEPPIEPVGERYKKGVDPFEFCTQAAKRLPSSLHGVKALGQVIGEKIQPDMDYCSADHSKCEIRDVKLHGLEVSLLVSKASSSVGILTLTIDAPKWRTLTPLRVGARLSGVENYFGVKAKPGSSVLRVYGDCTPLDVHHANGRVTKLHLDCQQCI